MFAEKAIWMRAHSLAIGLLFLLGSWSCANSWSEDDSHYVSLGTRNGYYIVRLDSQLSNKLGLFDAPWIDMSDPLRHGYGTDVLAFRFNRNGILIAPPAYIAQASANDFYMRKIGSLVRGRTNTHDVEAMFGHGHSDPRRPNGFVYYYALPVYNSFEGWGGATLRRYRFWRIKGWATRLRFYSDELCALFDDALAARRRRLRE